MELTLHPIATKCFVSGRGFQEDDRVASYLVREATGEVARRDLLESEDGRFMPPAFIYCRWVVAFKQRKAEEDPARTLKLTAENLFLTLAALPGSVSEGTAFGANTGLAAPRRAQGPFGFGSGPELVERLEHVETAAGHGAGSSINTPLLQFLTLMLERKKLIKLRGRTEDGMRQIYEHMPTHQFYEVPVGDLNVEFFQKIQEHLGVLVGTPKPKTGPAPAAAHQ